MQRNSTDIIMSDSLNHSYPVFNNKYFITRSLGQGNTSKVYLG